MAYEYSVRLLVLAGSTPAQAESQFFSMQLPTRIGIAV